MSKSPSSLKTLSKSVNSDGHKFTVLRPSITATYYAAAKLRALAPLMADSIESYRTFVGPGSLGFTMAEDGTMKKLDDKRLSRDLALLRKLPKSAEDFGFQYSSSGDGGIGEFDLTLSGDDPEEVFPNQTSLVRFSFPEDALDRFGEDKLLQFLFGEADRLKIQSGNIGWTFMRADPFPDEATAEADKLLPRFLGFDPGYKEAAQEMRGFTPCAHWINLIDKELFARCGTEAALKEAAPGVKIQALGDLKVIRGSKLPPLGDANRGAPDLGCLPGVARFLKPTRFKIGGFGSEGLDMDAWLGRFDELKVLKWDNS